MKTMNERNHRCITIQSNADDKRPINGPKIRYVLTDKIGAIFSRACSSRRRAPKASFYTGVEENECTQGKERAEHGVALNKSHQMQVANVDARKRHRRRSLASSLSGIFRKSSIGFNLRKWKAIKIGFANATTGPVLKPSFMRKRDVQGEEKRWGNELCKRRILMGEKCRALNRSGVLHYDNQGILLPEDDVLL